MDLQEKLIIMYDSVGNLIFEMGNSTCDNGDIVPNMVSNMTDTNFINPITTLCNETYSKFANHIFYSIRSEGINLGLGPKRLSSNLLNFYEYSLFTNFLTFLINELNNDGLIELITYETKEGSGMPFSSFKEEFYCQ